jgi:hypothetical protein
MLEVLNWRLESVRSVGGIDGSIFLNFGEQIEFPLTELFILVIILACFAGF